MSRGSIRDLSQFVGTDAFVKFSKPLPPEQLVLASYTFLPYVRSGIAATLTTPFSFAAPARATVNVTVPIVADAGTVVAGPVPVTVRGPGDVASIDAMQVIRTWPLDGHANAETEDLVQVEFDRPDFPWMFTPTAPDAQGRLVPWVTLIVAARGAYTLERPPGRYSANSRQPRSAPAAGRRLGVGAHPGDGRDEPGRSECADVARAAPRGRESDDESLTAALPASSGSRYRVHRLHRADFSSGRGSRARQHGHHHHARAGLDARRGARYAHRLAGVLLLYVCDRRGRGLRVACAATEVDSCAAQCRPPAARHVESGERDRAHSRWPDGTGAGRRGPGCFAGGPRRAGRMAFGGGSGMAGRCNRYAARAAERRRRQPASSRSGRACGADRDAAALCRHGDRAHASRGGGAAVVPRSEPRAETPGRRRAGHSGRPDGSGSADGVGVESGERRGSGEPGVALGAVCAIRRGLAAPAASLGARSWRAAGGHRTGSCTRTGRAECHGLRASGKQFAAAHGDLGGVSPCDAGARTGRPFRRLSHYRSRAARGPSRRRGRRADARLGSHVRQSGRRRVDLAVGAVDGDQRNCDRGARARECPRAKP